MTIKTERLLLREMEQGDYDSLKKILQDADVMVAYEGPFDDSETKAWLDRQLLRYKELGFGLWAVILRETGEMIGQCGLTMQDYKGGQVLEIGYLFQKAFWHKGYATEAAASCKVYAFDVLGADQVFSIIRDTNTPSQRVAIRNGMTVVDRFVKHYRGVDMPHLLFSVSREASKQGAENERLCAARPLSFTSGGKRGKIKKTLSGQTKPPTGKQ